MTRSDQFILTGAILWAVVQGTSQWCIGAREEPLSLFRFCNDGIISLLLFTVWGIFSVVRFRQAKVKTAGTVIIWALIGVAFIIIPVQTKLFGRYLEQRGERHLLAKLGGTKGMSYSCLRLLSEIQAGHIHVVNNRVPVSELSRFSILGRWHFDWCSYNSGADPHEILFGLGDGFLGDNLKFRVEEDGRLVAGAASFSLGIIMENSIVAMTDVTPNEKTSHESKFLIMDHYGNKE